ncbi:MAG: hypothetical protein ACOVRP_03325 [Gemmatimonas sp.]
MDTEPLQLVTAMAPRPRPRRRRWLRYPVGIFVITVLLPTLLASAYFGLVASDVYVSESRFVVRSPQRPAQTGLGALLQGTAFSRAQDDTYSVHDFVRSRDALRELDSRLKVRAAYSRTDIDALSRFPGIEWWDDSFEALHRYYQEQVQISYDSVSSISVLKVSAFSAADAARINQALLEMGERLVNQMNLRSRKDLIDVAELEVQLAEKRSEAAALALSKYRAQRGVFDPERQGNLQLQAVARLREELLAAEGQLAQVMEVSPDNPQVATLAARVRQLRAAVAAETSLVTAREGGLSALSPEFDRLSLEKTFADRQLGTALAALDSARSEAARKQLYLERLVQPNLPDRAVEPRRLRAVVTVLLVGLMLWGVISLVVAGVREHVE